MKKFIFVLLSLLIFAQAGAADTVFKENQFLVLCYHDIPETVQGDIYAVDQKSFIEQLEYLRTHGYRFISLDDIERAHQSKKNLPDKSILLTFDDGYVSFYEFVYPVLKLYGYPCVLDVVTGWIENKPPADIKAPLMNWKQLKIIARDPLVEIASHSDNLHRGVLYNPQGNTGHAAISRIYDPASKQYETEQAYRSRIYRDLQTTRKILHLKLGANTRSLVWPYGMYSTLSIEEAQRAGFSVMFTTEEGRLADTAHLQELHRSMIMKNPAIETFIADLKQIFRAPKKRRILQADIDLIYDPDPVQQEKNLDMFIERVFTMKVNTVYLQAFSDVEGSGNISSVYFPNRVLPMRADLFNRVVNQLFVRGIEVYAWMPMLSIDLPGDEDDQVRVMELRDNEQKPSTSWYKRLSPFNEQVRAKLTRLYEDVAANAGIAGVVFQDDGYLNDYEDYSKDALEEYKKIISTDIIPFDQLDPDKQKQWTKTKTTKLLELTEELKKAVVKYRPNAVFARTLYAPVLLNPASEEWFAQNYAESLVYYDFVVIMAYPKMEEISQTKKWLKKLVNEAKKYPNGIEKTVFKIQTYDWNKDRWIPSRTLDTWLRVLVAQGAQHVGYYPDNFIEHQPVERTIRKMMSVEDFPFTRR